MRYVILALVLSLAAACSTSSASKLDPSARNLVCERVAALNPKAECVAEMSDVGDGHVHTARVTFDAKTQDGKLAKVTRACGLAVGQVGMVCGELEQVAQQPKQAEQPAAETK